MGLFSYSLIYTVRFLMPVEAAYLIEPKTYYLHFRKSYEQHYIKKEVNALIKASYINELERAIVINKHLFERKNGFYRKAFTCALLSCIPYLICLGFEFSIKEKKVRKVKIVHNLVTLNK